MSRVKPPAPDHDLEHGQQIDSLTHCHDKVDPSEAIRERLQLHPRAMTHEIVAMLEMEGVHVTAEEVERLRSSV